MHTRSNTQGFTLMEVIGVLAVIAILAAVATPQIFQAIQDARVSTLVQEANDLKAAVARYYQDTGTWPRHAPTRPEGQFNQLMQNVAAGGGTIPGWNGPYLEKELTNPIAPGGYVDVLATNSASYACDLNGDGAQDGTFMVYRVDGVDDAIAEKVSNSMDKDGGTTTGTGDWKAAGRVKRFAGNHPTILVFCLARI
ncbi:MAG: prepilin-type N-terminal cleavage/methylation domain-containing protein [Pseudomonadota bacterium]